jgi:TonB-dependent starch-binding outer membrane protein SusC
MKKFLLFIIFFHGVAVFAQQEIKGVVTSADDGQTLPGVNVVIKGTTTGTITDIDGSYSIMATKGQVLQFSYVGMVTQEITVGDQTSINVVLHSDVAQLQELVVIGYGAVQKKDLTGSVGSIKSEEISSMPSVSPAEALQGKVSGVQVINNGLPGSAPEILIRGVGSIQAGTNPLYVVDGIITSDIRNLNNEDILSIDILKDASAQAIYGARASNGVIMITTKTGTKGKMKVSYHGFAGLNVVAKKVKMADSKLYGEYTNEALAYDNKPPAFEDLNFMYNTNWLDEVTRNGFFHQHTVTLSGGTDQITYLISLGYLNEEGIQDKNNYERFTLRVNNEYKVAKFLKFGNSIGLSTYNSDNPNTSVFNSAYRQGPNVPVKDENGDWGNSNNVNNVGNPVASLYYWNSLSTGYRIQGSFWGEVNIWKDLKFKSSFGIDVENNNGKNYTPVYNVSSLQHNDISNLSVSNNSLYHYTWDNVLSYKKSFKGKHNTNIMVGITNEELKSNYLSGYRQDVPPLQNYWYLDLGNATGAINGNGGDKWRRMSYFGRVSYNYKGKYFITGTIRREGSSRFSADNRWGWFPAVGAGWRISDENFLAGSRVLSNLKLRFSYGITGNDNIATNLFLYTINSGIYYPFNGEILPGSTITEIKDPNLTWESSEGIDIGLDYGFLDDRLSGEIDYYYKTTNDLLFPLPVPAILGSSSYVTNIAQLVNKGIEFALNWNDMPKKGLSYSLGLNFTYNINTITDLANGLPINGGSLNNGQFVTRTEVGQPVGSFWVYETDGIFQTQEEIDNSAHFPGTKPGDLKYKDNNGDGILDDDDRIYSGSYQPKFYFGFNFSLDIKNFDIGMSLFGNFGNKVYNGKKAQRWGGENIEESLKDRWTPENTSTDIPRASNAVPVASDYYLESGSFLRFNQITLGYTIPLNSKIISRLRVYLSSRYPFTIMGFSGFNPELPNGVMNSGIELDPIPTTSKYMFGVNLEF